MAVKFGYIRFVRSERVVVEVGSLALQDKIFVAVVVDSANTTRIVKHVQFILHHHYSCNLHTSMRLRLERCQHLCPSAEVV